MCSVRDVFLRTMVIHCNVVESDSIWKNINNSLTYIRYMSGKPVKEVKKVETSKPTQTPTPKPTQPTVQPTTQQVQPKKRKLSEEAKRSIGEKIRKHWQDPVYRQKVIEGLRRARAKKKQSQQTK